MISDGFGDSLTPEERAANFENYAHRVAHDSAGWDVHDDLVQEALIEVWKVATRKPDENPTYYAEVVKRRIRDVAWSGKPFTGGDSKPGPKSRPTENRVDWQDSATQDAFGMLLTGSDVLAGVEWAYHEGEILEALNGLPVADREYVVRRFWHGQTDTEIAALSGVSNKMLGNRWKRTIRPQLVESLSHLIDA